MEARSLVNLRGFLVTITEKTSRMKAVLNADFNILHYK